MQGGFAAALHVSFVDKTVNTTRMSKLVNALTENDPPFKAGSTLKIVKNRLEQTAKQGDFLDVVLDVDTHHVIDAFLDIASQTVEALGIPATEEELVNDLASCLSLSVSVNEQQLATVLKEHNVSMLMDMLKQPASTLSNPDDWENGESRNSADRAKANYQ